jgi:hypothetical protein
MLATPARFAENVPRIRSNLKLSNITNAHGMENFDSFLCRSSPSFINGVHHSEKDMIQFVVVGHAGDHA